MVRKLNFETLYIRTKSQDTGFKVNIETRTPGLGLILRPGHQVRVYIETRTPGLRLILRPGHQVNVNIESRTPGLGLILRSGHQV